MPETQYDRPLEAYNGMGYGKTLPVTEPELDDEKEASRDKRIEDVHVESAADGTPRLIQITSLTRPDIDNVNFMPRTWLTDLRPFQRKLNPILGLTTFKHALQLVGDGDLLIFGRHADPFLSCFSPMFSFCAGSTSGT